MVGPKGATQIKEGLIVAQRHIHMTPCDARELGVHDGEIVSIKFDTIRGGIFNNVAIRANDASKLECHLDIEEVNAMGINSKSKVEISIKFDTIRGGIFNNVAIRANDASKLECHLDIEEVNAMGINSKSKVEIVKH